MGEKIYFDTNQIYFIRRIADEAEGFEYGDYSWANKVFPHSPEMVADIKALCYIISLQYQWDLEFCASNASYTELINNTSNRAHETRKAWEAAGENLINKAQKLPSIEQKQFDIESITDNLEFIKDKADREIIRDFMRQEADVLFTSDDDILKHKNKLVQMGIKVMRPSEWINEFLQEVRGEEDGVQWVERILFTTG
ncbi:MAG: hypothetical protein JXA17_08210 [Dehalococcoidales bacterium]|nr:hypothetical protein [Dehalococcoidales bacterium]